MLESLQQYIAGLEKDLAWIRGEIANNPNCIKSEAYDYASDLCTCLSKAETLKRDMKLFENCVKAVNDRVPVFKE
jgi:hypothetical protein